MASRFLAKICQQSSRNGLLTWSTRRTFQNLLCYGCCIKKGHSNLWNSHRNIHFTSSIKTSDVYEKLDKCIREPDLCSPTESEIPEKSEEDIEKEASEILANLSPEEEKKLKILKLEHQILQEKHPNKIPEVITNVMWVELMRLPSVTARKKKYAYDRIKENHKKKKMENQLLRNEEKEEKESDGEKMPKNTIFLRILEKTMNKTCKDRIIKSMMFGPHIVFDMGLEPYMQSRESKNLLKQMVLAHAGNKNTTEPFHFVLTNVDPNGEILQQISDFRTFTDIYTVTDKNYLDLFPKENLVYLTPDAPNDLRSFSYNDVYIIGGLVDKTCQKKVTLAKAKEEGLRIAKFPIDKHLMWNLGTKSLTIDQVVNIMITLKDTNDWKEALKFVPQRKILDTSQVPEKVIIKKKFWKPRKPHLVYL